MDIPSMIVVVISNALSTFNFKVNKIDPTYHCEVVFRQVNSAIGWKTKEGSMTGTTPFGPLYTPEAPANYQLTTRWSQVEHHQGVIKPSSSQEIRLSTPSGGQQTVCYYLWPYVKHSMSQHFAGYPPPPPPLFCCVTVEQNKWPIYIITGSSEEQCPPYFFSFFFFSPVKLFVPLFTFDRKICLLWRASIA